MAPPKHQNKPLPPSLSLNCGKTLNNSFGRLRMSVRLINTPSGQLTRFPRAHRPVFNVRQSWVNYLQAFVVRIAQTAVCNRDHTAQRRLA
jgi:hypothetical protein